MRPVPFSLVRISGTCFGLAESHMGILSWPEKPPEIRSESKVRDENSLDRHSGHADNYHINNLDSAMVNYILKYLFAVVYVVK